MHSQVAETNKAIKGRKLQQNRMLAQEKMRQAMELRKAGMSYRDIALRVPFSSASHARTVILKGMKETIQEPTEELRALQTERLNHMLLVLWPKVSDPDHPGNEAAIDRALSILRELNNLHGTNVPVFSGGGDTNVNVGVLVIDGDKNSYIEALAKMAGAEPPKALVETTGTELPVIDAEIVEYD